MSDRYHALTVILEQDANEEQMAVVSQAIHMIKGVQAVKPHVADATLITASMRARADIGMKIIDAVRNIVYPK
jgi:hypothetical protein